MSLLPSGAIESAGYDINNSLRLRRSALGSLSRTPSSTGNRKTFTWSGWVKRGLLDATQRLFMAGTTGGSNPESGIQFYGASNVNSLEIYYYVSGYQWQLTTTQLFRDPSAWYHIVVAVDTTQGTASNRIKMYVNGSQITTFSTANYPTQNSDTVFNTSGTANHLGTLANDTANNFDGYLAEVNFVDGSQLTPSSFGETDTITGVWKAKKYTGTYGTNGFYLPFKAGSASSYAGSFNGSSQYLSSSTSLFNYTTANASTQTATIEAMVYLNSYQTPSQTYYSPCIAGKGDVYMNLGVNGSGNLIFYHYDGTARNITGSSVIPLNTWTYVAVVISGGTATLYVNGTSVGSGTWYGIQSAGQNSTSYFGRAATNASALYLNGYISNLRVSSTARTISTPSAAYSNDANTNFLTLQSSTVVDNSTNAYAITNTGTVTTSVSYPFYTTSVSADYSGNANNWTSNNINVASVGTTYDAMKDSPTNTSATVANYCVLNPIGGNSSMTLSNGNLNTSATAAGLHRYGTIGVTSGKWYWEASPTLMSGANNGMTLGISNNIQETGSTFTGMRGYFSNDGKAYTGTSGATYGATWTTNDIIGMALDLDAGTLIFYKNGVSQGTAFTGLTGEWFPLVRTDITVNSWINFGQRPFSYTPPSGYVALNTYNLPTPTILQGNKYMDATLVTATGTTQSVTNTAGFQPDFLWSKQRNSANDNYLIDSVRGVSKYLISNKTDAEATATQFVTSFNSNGFTMGTSNYSNGSTVVGWQWQAGAGTTSTNTSGSISSTVSVNTTAGFSIVTYTGTGANATVGHGLGVAPKFTAVKCRNDGTIGWVNYHASLGNTQFLNLNSTNAAGTGSTVWNNTSPTSTTIALGTDSAVNGSTKTYVIYAWAAIAGFSAFGSYTGNGSTDGPFVATNFKPKYVMIKRTDSTGEWLMFDMSRSTYNQVKDTLLANSSGSEFSYSGGPDFLSNGIKIRGSGSNTDINASGGTYIYMAFAENPFKNSLAR